VGNPPVGLKATPTAIAAGQRRAKVTMVAQAAENAKYTHTQDGAR